MKLARRIGREIALEIVSIFAKILYFAGLASLIPLVPLVFHPAGFAVAKYALITSVVTIILSFLIVYWSYKSKKFAFRTLGFATLVPGIIAVLLLFAGPIRITSLLSVFGKVSPYLKEFINTQIPKAWLLAGIYIIIGVALVRLSYSTRK